MKTITKCIAVILSFALSALPAAAAAGDRQACYENYPYTLEDMNVIYNEVDENGNYYPLVIVPGISHSITYVIDENYDFESAADKSKPPVKQDAFGSDMTGSTLIFDLPATICNAAAYLIAPLIASIIFQTDCGLVDAVEKVADAAFSVQQTLPDGSYANNKIGLLEFNGSLADFDSAGKENENYMEYQCSYLYKILPLNAMTDIIGKDNVFFFTFSLFADPMSAADNLDKYIDMVLEKTGASKVNLLPISLGGTVFTAFCQKYTDTNKVNAVANIVPVLNGTQAVTDMLNRDFDVSGDFWYQELFPLVISEFTEYGGIIGHLLNIMIRTLPSNVNAAMITRIYDVLLDHLLINTPQIWSMVNREAYPALAERYLNDSEHSPVRALTDAFYEAQMNLEKNIKTMTANGIEINIISGYSLHTGDARYKFFSLMKNSGNVNSDGVINVESTTLGATAALPGESLNYTSPGGYSYISPDGEIDASTGVLPDNTWYFYDMHHEDAANNAPVINLVLALLYSDEVDSVHSNPEKFPQFNGNSDNWFIRRWRYNDLKAIYRSYLDGETDMTGEDVKECEALLYDCERVMKATIADAEFCRQTTYRVNVICSKYGTLPDEAVNIVTQKQLPELTGALKGLTTAIKAADNLMYAVFGTKAFSQFWQIIF